MDEQAIKLEMRLSAIEYLLSKVYLAGSLSSGARPDQLSSLHEEFLAGARQQLFPVGDPALSDLVSAEWEAAIERLLKMQRELLAPVPRK